MRMFLIPDDPIIRSIEQSGYPWWMFPDVQEEGEEMEDDDNERNKQ